MKKSITHALVLVSILCLILNSCSSGDKMGTMSGKSYRTQGWIDENTFRIAARGAYPKDEENEIVKQEMAKRAAIINAQFQVLEKFTGSKIEGASGMKNFRITGIAVSQEVAGVIKGGSVYKETYNNYGCEVIFEVKAKGLKNKVKASQIKGSK